MKHLPLIGNVLQGLVIFFLCAQMNTLRGDYRAAMEDVIKAKIERNGYLDQLIQERSECIAAMRSFNAFTDSIIKDTERRTEIFRQALESEDRMNNQFKKDKQKYDTTFQYLWYSPDGPATPLSGYPKQPIGYLHEPYTPPLSVYPKQPIGYSHEPYTPALPVYPY